MSVPVLQTVGLEKRFGGVHAIAGVDFSLAEGELRCLIGPNGAGKSTFFKMVTGQIAPTAGRIVFAGTDITRAAAASGVQRWGSNRSGSGNQRAVRWRT